MLAESVSDLLKLAREELDDVVQFQGDDDHTLWKTPLLLAYCTEGTDLVAKKTEGLYRALVLRIVAGQRLVRLPGYVRHIRSAALASTGEPLREINLNDPARFLSATDYGAPTSLLDDSPGVPSAYTRDYSAKGLLLDRAPQTDDGIDIQCSVTLAEPLALDDDFPLTDPEDQRLVLTFIKYRAYGKHDADTYDLQRAIQYRDEFMSDLSARAVDLRSVRRAPGAVRMDW